MFLNTLKITAIASLAVVAATAARPANAQGLDAYARMAQLNHARAWAAINQAYAGFSPAARRQAELNTSSLRLAQQMQTGQANMDALRARQQLTAQGYAFSSQLRAARRAFYW